MSKVVSSNLDFQSTARGINHPDPVSAQDVATKAYVDQPAIADGYQSFSVTPGGGSGAGGVYLAADFAALLPATTNAVFSILADGDVVLGGFPGTAGREMVFSKEQSTSLRRLVFTHFSALEPTVINRFAIPVETSAIAIADRIETRRFRCMAPTFSGARFWVLADGRAVAENYLTNVAGDIPAHNGSRWGKTNIQSAQGTSLGRTIAAGGSGLPVPLTGAQQGENIRFNTRQTVSVSGVVDIALNDDTTILVLQLSADATLRSLNTTATGDGRLVRIEHDSGVNFTLTLGHNMAAPTYFPLFNSNETDMQVRRGSTVVFRVRSGFWRPELPSHSIRVRKNSTGAVLDRARLNVTEGPGISVILEDVAAANELKLTIGLASGVQSIQGPPGADGSEGPEGERGQPGERGPQGAYGGAITIPYRLVAGTTDVDPGSGNLAIDFGGSFNGVSLVRLDDLGGDGVSWASTLQSLASISNPVKAHMRLVRVSNPAEWVLYSVSNVITASGYTKFAVSFISGVSSFGGANIPMQVLISPFGDRGLPGMPGAEGREGNDGEQGPPGPPGPSALLDNRSFSDLLTATTTAELSLMTATFRGRDVGRAYLWKAYWRFAHPAGGANPALAFNVRVDGSTLVLAIVAPTSTAGDYSGTVELFFRYGEVEDTLPVLRASLRVVNNAGATIATQIMGDDDTLEFDPDVSHTIEMVANFGSGAAGNTLSVQGRYSQRIT